MIIFDGGALACGDGSKLDLKNKSILAVIDPPWNAGLWPDFQGSAGALVFCDGQRIGTVVSQYGPPAWSFVWDCGSCWYTPNRPIKKHKLCLWYGDVSQYRDEYRDGSPAGLAKTVTNTRSTYKYTPDKNGKRLIDVYCQPITQSAGRGGAGHGKPVDWIEALITNCRGDATTVADPFAGTGAVAIAAHRAGLCYIGCEIDAATHSESCDRVKRYVCGSSKNHGKQGQLI